MQTETNQETSPKAKQKTKQKPKRKAKQQTEQSTHPSLGEMIKLARMEKNLSQEALAHDTETTQDMVSKIEVNRYIPSNEILQRLKFALNIEWIPFVPEERQGYRLRLKEWFAAMDENDTEKANDMQKKLREILTYPHEVELRTTYETVALRWHLSRHEKGAVEALLQRIAAKEDTLSDMQRYYFKYSQGIFYMRQLKLEEALAAYSVAYKLSEQWESKNEKACYNIARCYNLIGYSHKAVFYLRKMDNLFSEKNKSYFAYRASALLVASYISTFCLENAKEILDTLETHALNALDDNEKGGFLLNYGYLYRKAGEWKKAIEYLDEALELPGLTAHRHMELFYQKAWCLIELGYPKACAEVLEQAKKVVEKNEGADWREEYFHCFQGLEAVLSIASRKSRDYLDETIFPYFQKHGASYAIIDFYMYLIPYYRRTNRSQAKVIEMMMTVFDLQNKMLEGGGIA